VFLYYIKIAPRTCLDLAVWLHGVFEAAFFMIRFKSHVQ